jgi:hypothetical protein
LTYETVVSGQKSIDEALFGTGQVQGIKRSVSTDGQRHLSAKSTLGIDRHFLLKIVQGPTSASQSQTTLQQSQGSMPFAPTSSFIPSAV